MSNAAVKDGQTSGQASGAEGDDSTGGGESSSSGNSKLENMEARLDLIADGFAELRQAILDRGGTHQQAAAALEEVDDGEPLTASKIQRIVNNSLKNVVADSTNLTQRQQWDTKAKEEFPLSDPKFLREFKKEWKEQTDAGLDPRHPKAVYNVAKITARSVGVKKVEDPAERRETTQTSEAPSSRAQQVERRGGSRSTVSDDDPRVKFYGMKNDKSKEQVAAFKAKLSERDAKRRPAR